MSADLTSLRTKLEPVFLAEIDDALVAVSSGIDCARAGGRFAHVRDAVREALHAIEGAATTLGFDEVAGYLGCVDTRVASCDSASDGDAAEIVALLESVVEMMREWIASVRDARPFDKHRFEVSPAVASPSVLDRSTPPGSKGTPVGELPAASPELLERAFEHLMQLEMARTRLHHRIGRERFDSDLDALEQHGRALRDLLGELSPEHPAAYVEAQIICVAGRRFALPLHRIIEARLARRERIEPLAGDVVAIESRGMQIPVVDLASLLGEQSRTAADFLLVVEIPAEEPRRDAPGPGPVRLALAVEAVEDPEFVAGPECVEKRSVEISRNPVALASGAEATWLDLEGLFEASARAGHEAPSIARASDSRTSRSRSIASNTWRTLARHSLDSNQGGRDGRFQ